MKINSWKIIGLIGKLISSVPIILLIAGCGGKKAPLAVGLVFDVGGRGDKSFNDSAYRGLEKAKKELGVSVDFIEPASVADRSSALSMFASGNYDLIIGVGVMFSDEINKVAESFPGKMFACIDHSGIPVDRMPSNLKVVKFKEEEGSALAGALAGLSTKTGLVGFIGGMDIPLIRKFEEGFEFGVKYANPVCKVFSVYTGTTPAAFQNPEKGYELALAMYKKGADVIYHAAGATGLGVFEAAKKTKKLVIGVDSDQYMAGFVSEGVGSRTLTSMIKRVDNAIYDVIKNASEGNFTGGAIELGLKEGGVSYVLDANNIKKFDGRKIKIAEKLKEEIIAGKIIVPNK